MRRPRALPVVGKHFLGIAVVCRNERRAAFFQHRAHHARDTRIHGLDGFHCRVDDAGVAHHVAVRVVHDVDVGRVGAYGRLQLLRHLRRAHLGFEVVGGHLGRVHEAALLAVLGRLHAAVEEKGDVRVLFRLGRVKLAQAACGQIVGQYVFGMRLREGHGRVEGLVVFGHAHEVHLRHMHAVELVEGAFRRNEGAGELAGAVGAEVEEDDRVAVVDPAVVEDRGDDELVGDVGGVARLHRPHRRPARKALALPEADGVPGLLHAVPAIVAVHGVVAPRYRGHKRHRAVMLLEYAVAEIDDALHVALAGMRVDVAAVHEGVDAHVARAALGRHLQHGLQVRHVRVYAAIGEQTHEVDGAPSLDGPVEGGREHLVVLDGAVLAGVVDARELLGYHAPGAHVQVPDLGVAHLAVGQPHIAPRRAQSRVRAIFPRSGKERLVGQLDGVARPCGCQPIAVHDRQKHRFHRMRPFMFAGKEKSGQCVQSALRHAFCRSAFSLRRFLRATPAC